MSWQDEMVRASRLVEDTLGSLGIEPSGVRVKSPPGVHAWSVLRGTVAIAVVVRAPRDREDAPCFRVVAPVMTVPPDAAAPLHAHLLELNASGLGPAAFGVQDAQVLVVSERPTVGLGPMEVRHALHVVGSVANRYGETLTARFGGVRASVT